MKDDLTLMQFFDQVFCLKPEIAGGSPRTIDVYRVDVRLLNKVFRARLLETEPDAKVRDMRPSDFATDLIERTMAFQLNQGRSRSTCNRVRRVANSIWNWAQEKGYSEASQKKVSKYREPIREPVAWSIEEFERILFAAGELTGTVGPFSESEWFAALLWTVYNSGVRITAVMAIQWDWIDLGERRLVIEPEVQKDSEGQVVKLIPETVELLRKLQGNGKPGVFDDWPFDRGGDTWPALTKVLKRLLIDAGLRADMRSVSRRDLWHKIRRTFATACYEKTGDIELVREWLGHSSSEITWRYIDKSKLNRKSQADVLPIPNPKQLRLFRDNAS